MKLDEIVAWYQKKIGTYDKQQWEKTVEQKILDGFTSFTLKNAKLRTEFIDVDLVRGSTFPKAKPKQSLLTVIRLAVLRYFFLPIYAKWWVQQTSPTIVGILLFLYLTQMISWAVYTFNVHRMDNDVEHIVSLSELLIPMALSFVLSLIHSQIVATSSGNGLTTKHKRYCTSAGKQKERVKRRKKLVKMRNVEMESTLNHSNVIKNSRSRVSTPQDGVDIILNKQTSISPVFENQSSAKIHKNQIEQEISLDSKQTSSMNTNLHKLSLNLAPLQSDSSLNDCVGVSKKRNVNWDSPIHNFATELQTDKLQIEVNQIFTTSKDHGECSLNVKPTTMQVTAQASSITEHQNEKSSERNVIVKRIVGEDDGFESLNGKSSSGEENVITSAGALQNTLPIDKSQIRLRLTSITAKSKDEHLGIDSLTAVPTFRRKYPLSSESDMDRSERLTTIKTPMIETFQKKTSKLNSESSDTDEEGDEGETMSSAVSPGTSNYNECTTSATEWLGITTNSEECSYSSELENSDYKHSQFSEDEGYDMDFIPATILTSHGNTDRISCTLWDQREIKKTQMSVLDISSCIIERVEAMPETCDYIYIGLCFSVILSLIPSFCRLCEATVDSDKAMEINYFDVPMLLWEKASFSFITILRFAFGNSQWERIILVIGFVQRLFLTLILFMLFAVAERTFKQRFLYAKLFSHLTSSRRARKSDLPHFRLNKVRNIKTWLSVRSYLKKRGPQRSVDLIVSAVFLLTLLLLAFLSVEWLKDSVHLHSHLNLEALLWSSAMGIFLLRYMTLGNKINRKYRSISVLITEQINLYLQIEQKPKKKDELMVSNSVLKLAGDLLKELESPFKISGLSANPYLYTTIKVVILSALSGVLSEMLGFKLKLHKIKIK